MEDNPQEAIRNNVFGTKNVVDLASKFDVERFVLVSTDKAVRPKSVMGASKRMAELIVQDLATRAQATRFSMVRFGNVLGSSGSVYPLFQEQIARGGDVFVLDMGDPVPIRRLAETMIEGAGLTVRDATNPHGDIEIVVTGLRPGEKMHEELLIGSDRVTTPHPSILRAQEDYLSEIEVANMLRDMQQAIETADLRAARKCLLRWIEDNAFDEDTGTVIFSTQAGR
jgi:FlaA1/EpsC-like NDP-sugar epimerase